MKRESAALRTYRALLSLYPRAFREEFGADMALLFQEQCRDEPMWRVCSRAFADLVLTVPRQYVEEHMHRNPAPVLTVGGIAVALAGAGVVVAGGSAPAMTAVGLLMVLAGASFAIATRRRAAPLRDTGASLYWIRFLVAGPLLIGSVIVGASLGVEAWEVGFGLVAAGFVSMGIGTILGVVRIATRMRQA